LNVFAGQKGKEKEENKMLVFKRIIIIDAAATKIQKKESYSAPGVGNGVAVSDDAESVGVGADAHEIVQLIFNGG
jgi:hypothetical protein